MKQRREITLGLKKADHRQIACNKEPGPISVTYVCSTNSDCSHFKMEANKSVIGEIFVLNVVKFLDQQES